ncbi:MAG: hypothetical protein D6744_11075 [Planctomycetota bacterium]|nr:MAG: hypothetical protein D6744_11075 [Planctomycetota bacterium]
MLMLAGLLVAGRTPLGTAGESEDISTARYVLRTEATVGESGLSTDAIEAILNSEDLKVRAAEAAGLNPDVSFEISVVDVSSFGKMVSVELRLAMPSARAEARKLLAALCSELRAALERIGERDLAELQHRLEAARKQLAQLNAEMQQLREQGRAMMEAAGRASLDPEKIAAELAGLQSRARELEAELLASKAEEEAVTQQIEQVRERMESAVDDDELLHELAEIVRLRERQATEWSKHSEQGEAGGVRAGVALEKLAEARARFAERREALRRERGGELIQVLSERLMDNAVRTAELVARLSDAKARIEEAHEKDLLVIAQRYQAEVAQRLDYLQGMLFKVQRDIAELETQAREYRPPVVFVVGT